VKVVWKKIHGLANFQIEQLVMSMLVKSIETLSVKLFEVNLMKCTEVLRVIRNEPSWEIVNEIPEEGVVEFVATTKLMKYKDDVVVVVSNDPEGTQPKRKCKPAAGDGFINEFRFKRWSSGECSFKVS
jgi:hypothetical protein